MPKLKLGLRNASLVGAALAIKAFLATVSPRSFDFVNIAYMGAYKKFRIFPLTPYVFTRYLMHLPYRLWLSLPIKHEPVGRLLRHGYFAATLEATLYLAVMKLPMLLFDGLTGLLVYKMVKEHASRDEAKLAAWLWFFNPYLTVAIEMDGTIDIVSAFLAAASSYLLVKKRFFLSGLLLAVASAARFWPLALLPIYLIILSKGGDRRGSATLILGFLGAAALLLYPFASVGRLSALKALYALPAEHKELTWFLGYLISSWGWRISVGVVACLYFLQAFLIHSRWRPSLAGAWDGAFAVLSSYIAFSYWNRYYTIWVAPFAIADYAMNRGKHGKLEYTILFAMFWLGMALFNFSIWWIPSLFYVHPYTGWLAKAASSVKNFGLQETSSLLTSTLGRSILAGATIIYLLKINFRNFRGASLKGNGG